MLRTLSHLVLCVSLLLPLACCVNASSPLSPDEARNWTMYLVPLPKSVAITGKVSLPARSVEIVLPPMPDYLVRQAVKELRETMGVSGSACVTPPAFRIKLQLKGQESEKLKSLKNREQAYSITPENGGEGLRLVALTSRGLYYAAKTLQQLIAARKSGNEIDLPVVSILDWPDMEDRGLWGLKTYQRLRWMGDRKLNIDEQISWMHIDMDGKGHARPKDGYETILYEGPYYGVWPVPVVLHLGFVSEKGVFAAFPNLEAQGGDKGAWCYSQPEAVHVIAEWVRELGKLPFVTEVDVWMTENLHGMGGCQCAECKKIDRDVQEARVIVAAWNRVKKERPRLGLRMLTSEETEDGNTKFIPELPKDVKIWYYGNLTYTENHKPMIPKYLEDFAKQGRWIGVCPSLGTGAGFTQPFTSPQFVYGRMSEFISKGLSGLLGYPSPRTLHFRFNVEAAAEWGWNLKGRTQHEFAYSWAVRQGFREPEKFAQWTDLHGPVTWDVHGSSWPARALGRRGDSVAQNLREGKLEGLRSPEEIFGDVKTVEQLDANVQAEARAVELARQMGIDEFVYESLVIQGYAQSMKALWELSRLVKDGRVADSDREAAQRWFGVYVSALRQSARALPKWERTISVPDDPVSYARKSAETVGRIIKDMQQSAEEMGSEVK